MKKEPREDFLKTLSQRTYNGLKRNTSPRFFKTFTTKEELIKLLETEGIHSRQIGEKGIKELENALGFELVFDEHGDIRKKENTYGEETIRH